MYLGEQRHRVCVLGLGFGDPSKVLCQLRTNWHWIIERSQKCMSRRGRVALAQTAVGRGQGCEVEVKIPTDPERDTGSLGPGVPIRERWRWKLPLGTVTSGIWVLPGALQGLGLEDALASSASWVGRGTYRTAWAVPPMSGCQCSYSYGHGPAIGPHTGQQTFWMLSCLWRALAP